MEDVLDLYAEPADPDAPRFCFDECPYQLLDHVREPLPPEPGKSKRVDYEDEREGTCNLFLFLEPTQGWRQVEVTHRRTKQDFAHAMKALVDVHFPDAPKIRVVLDNLNTHTFGSFYAAFEPEEARRIPRRLEFHSTPKHGRDRTLGSGSKVAGPTPAFDGEAPRGDRSLAAREQCSSRPSPVALYHSGCPGKIVSALPFIF